MPLLPAERFKGWLDSLSVAWGDKLRNWMARWVSWGIELFFDVLSKAAAPKLKPLIETLEKTGEVPPELQPLLDEMKSPTGQVGALFAQTAGGAIIGGAIGKMLDSLLNPLGYWMYRANPSLLPDYPTIMALWLRGQVKDEDMPYFISSQGFPKEMIPSLKDLAQIRLDPASWITTFRRKYPDFSKVEDDLKQQGWTEDRIKALKFLTLYYPSPAELIHWQAREVFEPTMVAKYGLTAEVEELERDAFYKAGMTDEQIDNHWKAHWVHPDWRQVADMYHRGLITFEDIERWYRVVEIPPYWRDKLTGITWDLPNRIETRMMARYGLVDKPWLVGHLERIGLHEDYRSIAADFMLAMGIRMDLSSRYSKGWLTADEVKSEIATFGMSEDINDRLYKWIVKNVQPDRVTTERDLTKAEVTAGVKKAVISPEQGVELLQDMGYDESEAKYIIEVRAGVLAGSPETYPEFKKWTQLYRKAEGLEAHIPPDDLIEASKAVVEAKKALSEAEEKELKGEKLAPYLKAISDAEYRYRQLLIAWEEEKKKAP